ncbi:hypothetical protein [Variovorax sp. WS11]|nr:hypothetical protein [Variovorax sp. WS11]NDZ11525.1 hypothetical protein [Variovorax sp. WS11]
MDSDDHDLTSTEDLDFIVSAALLWAGVLLLALYGDRAALFLNSLFLNL